MKMSINDIANLIGYCTPTVRTLLGRPEFERCCLGRVKIGNKRTCRCYEVDDEFMKRLRDLL